MSWSKIIQKTSNILCSLTCASTIIGNILLLSHMKNERAGDGTIYPILCIIFTYIMSYPIRVFYYFGQ